MKKVIVKEVTFTATCRVMADLYIYQNTYCEANQLYIYIYEKKKYQLLPEVEIPAMTSDVKITKFDKTLNTTLYTTPMTPPSTPSKPVICNIQTKRPLSDAEKANMKKIWQNVVIYNFNDEIDDNQLLTADLNLT